MSHFHFEPFSPVFKIRISVNKSLESLEPYAWKKHDKDEILKVESRRI